MANILGNVFKGKDSMNGGLATQGAGQSSQKISPKEIATFLKNNPYQEHYGE